MKISILLLAPAVVAADYCDDNPNNAGCPPTGYCAGAPIVTQLTADQCAAIEQPEPCYEYDLRILTDCNGIPENPCVWVGDGYCDDGTFFGVSFRCAEYDDDGGDCEMIYDCDGRLALGNLLGDGTCDDGSTTVPNFDCLDYDYDGGDCAPKNCDGTCVDDYATDDGTCQEAYNCKKFEYSFGQCAPPNICPTDWYDTGRENYRCSQRTGGNRFASKRMDDFNECECYAFCQDKAAEKGEVLSAFDHYSDKCRCWAGECTDRSLIECKADGVRADEFAPNGRCPSATYFPHDRELDCHPGTLGAYVQDVTPYANYFRENYYNDGYCDNAEFGVMNYTTYDYGDAPIGDYNCASFDYDGEDCEVATCDEIFAVTQFAALDDPNMVCDGHDNEITRETAWTTACDCYDFCAAATSEVEVMFQRNNHGQCQCLSHCDSQSSCGIESDCQIFYTERVEDCCGDDWTLGKTVTDIVEGTLGEFYTSRVLSLQENQQQDHVISYDYISTISSIDRQSYCVPEFMCVEHSYSFGEVDDDGDIVASPCFECLVETQGQLDSFTVADTRCDMSSNDGIRFMQLKDFYALDSGRSPFVLDDYCTCEIACRMAKFNFYATGACPAVSGMEGYDAWLADESTAFAVDSYKGDCRCWDYCTNETVWTCTAGAIDRCVEPVAVLLWTDPGNVPALPDERPNGGTN